MRKNLWSVARSAKHLICLFLLGALLSGCVTVNQMAVRKDDETLYGYRLRDGSVVFEFNRADYKYVTMNESGAYVAIEEINIKEVSVAGEFNSFNLILRLKGMST